MNLGSSCVYVHVFVVCVHACALVVHPLCSPPGFADWSLTMERIKCVSFPWKPSVQMAPSLRSGSQLSDHMILPLSLAHICIHTHPPTLSPLSRPMVCPPSLLNPSSESHFSQHAIKIAHDQGFPLPVEKIVLCGAHTHSGPGAVSPER